MSEPIGTDERLDRIEELEARIKELTQLCALEYQRAWLLETQKNIAEEKLAQQDNLWEAFKDRWTGERKYALRIIVKYLKGEQDAVDTPTDSNERRGS